jgi:hypothetical protein
MVVVMTLTQRQGRNQWLNNSDTPHTLMVVMTLTYR